jgi:hypothetical protein
MRPRLLEQVNTALEYCREGWPSRPADNSRAMREQAVAQLKGKLEKAAAAVFCDARAGFPAVSQCADLPAAAVALLLSNGVVLSLLRRKRFPSAAQITDRILEVKQRILESQVLGRGTSPTVTVDILLHAFSESRTSNAPAPTARRRAVR